MKNELEKEIRTAWNNRNLWASRADTEVAGAGEYRKVAEEYESLARSLEKILERI